MVVLRQMEQIKLLILTLMFEVSTCDVYHYHLDMKHYGSEENLRYRQSGMYAPNDAPSKTAPGYGHSYIDFGGLGFEVSRGALSMSYPGAVTYIEVAVFESSHFHEVGVDVRGAATRQYCCTPWVANRTNCHPNRGLIRNIDSDSSSNGTVEIYRVPVPLTEGLRVKMAHAGFEQLGHAPYSKYKIHKSGIYSILIANCDAVNGVDILVTGEARWMNPYGYLPGELYGMMPFFGVMASLYFVIGFTWVVLCLCYWSELLLLQRWISLVLFLGLLENSLKFGDFLKWNSDGERAASVLASSIVFGATKRAVSRVLVVLVSSGYAVVRPTLGTVIPKAGLLGMAYFGCALAYDLTVQLPSNSKLLGQPAVIDTLTVFMVLLATIDVVFYAWILNALVNTLTFLERKQEAIKLLLFRRFRAVLVLSVAFSCAWGLYSVIASAGGYYEDHWKSSWSVGAVWEVIYVMLLLAISFLWMPSKNAQRYAYSMQLKSFDPDEMDDMSGDDIGAHDIDYGDGDVDAEYGGALNDGGVQMLPRSFSDNIPQGTEKLN